MPWMSTADTLLGIHLSYAIYRAPAVEVVRRLDEAARASVIATSSRHDSQSTLTPECYKQAPESRKHLP